MTENVFNVLFLCTGNSARSILAEALLNHWGQGRFRGFSAGSHPAGRVNPGALELLTSLGFPTDTLRSKSWDEFEGPDAPRMDFVFTVCDNAAAEACPVWPGHPATAHWGLADPAAATGDDEERLMAFREAFAVLEHRIKRFVGLPLDELQGTMQKDTLADIGQSVPATE